MYLKRGEPAGRANVGRLTQQVAVRGDDRHPLLHAVGSVKAQIPVQHNAGVDQTEAILAAPDGEFWLNLAVDRELIGPRSCRAHNLEHLRAAGGGVGSAESLEGENQRYVSYAVVSGKAQGP